MAGDGIACIMPVPQHPIYVVEKVPANAINMQCTEKDFFRATDCDTI